jgi:hypothetical protein
VGAILATGGFYAYTKLSNNNQTMQMPGGTPPEMPNGERPEMPSGERPEMPNGQRPDMQNNNESTNN